MTKIEKFEDIVAWQEARSLTLQVYAAMSSCRDFCFRDQLQRASVSIMNNIAEGFERRGDKQFKHFLYIAKGSCAEVRSMLYLAEELGYLAGKQLDDLRASAISSTKLINAFIGKLD